MRVDQVSEYEKHKRFLLEDFALKSIRALRLTYVPYFSALGLFLGSYFARLNGYDPSLSWISEIIFELSGAMLIGMFFILPSLILLTRFVQKEVARLSDQ